MCDYERLESNILVQTRALYHVDMLCIFQFWHGIRTTEQLLFLLLFHLRGSLSHISTLTVKDPYLIHINADN